MYEWRVVGRIFGIIDLGRLLLQFGKYIVNFRIEITVYIIRVEKWYILTHAN